MFYDSQTCTPDKMGRMISLQTAVILAVVLVAAQMVQGQHGIVGGRGGLEEFPPNGT